jgi:hypothetical protein
MKTRLLNLDGKLVTKYVTKYLIDWDGKSASKLQFKAKQFLKTYWSSCEVYEEFPVFGSRMRVDIVNMSYNIAVEVNGSQHRKYNRFFHAGSIEKYRASLARDAKKHEWLRMNDFQLIEIEDHEIDKLSKEYFFEMFNLEL